MTIKKTKLITLGKLGASYGVRGWIRMNSFTEEPTDIFNYETLLIQNKFGLKEAKVEDWKIHSGHLICKLDLINSLEEAKEFNNNLVAVRQEDLPELDEGEFYWKDLIGCMVKTPNGYILGIVKTIMETGANDVLVLTCQPTDEFGKKERLIPFDPDNVITKVDLENKTIYADWDPDF